MWLVELEVYRSIETFNQCDSLLRILDMSKQYYTFENDQLNIGV